MNFDCICIHSNWSFSELVERRGEQFRDFCKVFSMQILWSWSGEETFILEDRRIYTHISFTHFYFLKSSYCFCGDFYLIVLYVRRSLAFYFFFLFIILLLFLLLLLHFWGELYFVLFVLFFVLFLLQIGGSMAHMGGRGGDCFGFLFVNVCYGIILLYNDWVSVKKLVQGKFDPPIFPAKWSHVFDSLHVKSTFQFE